MAGEGFNNTVQPQEMKYDEHETLTIFTGFIFCTLLVILKTTVFSDKFL